MPAEPTDFLTVAELLAEESAGDLNDSSEIWVECEDARARSAISRSYYAAFRYVKFRVMLRRPAWRADARAFPSRAIHEVIKTALSRSLGEDHELVSEMKLLVRRRNDADYTTGGAAVTCSDALDVIEASDNALKLIEALSEDQLDDIAFHVVQVDAELRSKHLRQ